MVSNGYRWRRYDNLIRSKRVTVYAKVQVMQQRYMPSRCHQVPRMPRETKVDVSKCHACHVKRRWMSQSATPATQSAATCRQVPRLPRKKPRRPRRTLRTERATRASPVPYVPRLPRETKVDVSKCHACHAKCSYMSPSATPATQKAAATTAPAENRARHQSQLSAIRATPAT